MGPDGSDEAQTEAQAEAQSEAESEAQTEATTGTPRPGLRLAIIGGGAAVVLGLGVLLIVVLGDPDVDWDAFCADARATEQAIQRPELVRSDLPRDDMDLAWEEFDAAVADLRVSAPPSLRAAVDRYTAGFDPPPTGGLHPASWEAGERIGSVVEAECGVPFDHEPPTPPAS